MSEPLSQNRLRLIELLLLLTIIGLVGTFTGIAVHAARSQQRDTVRIAEVREIQGALENYFLQKNAYPEGNPIPMGAGQGGCLSANGFQEKCDVSSTIFLSRLAAPLSQGLKGEVNCNGIANTYCYFQTKQGQEYRIVFELENPLPAAKLVKGTNCATPEGMQAGACDE